MRGNLDEAIDRLYPLLENDSKNYRFCLELADCLIRNGDRKGAVNLLESFLKHGSYNASVNNVVREVLERIR
jgi:hypothetical protein